jgi:hypothetical protein
MPALRRLRIEDSRLRRISSDDSASRRANGAPLVAAARLQGKEALSEFERLPRHQTGLTKMLLLLFLPRSKLDTAPFELAHSLSN